MESYESQLENYLIQEPIINKFHNTLLSNSTITEIDISHMYQHNKSLYISTITQIQSKIPTIQKTINRLVTELIIQKNEQFFNTTQQINCTVSFVNNFITQRIRDLKLDKLNKLVSFIGIVTRTTTVRPELKNGIFECAMCKTVSAPIKQTNRYTVPLICANHLCTNKTNWKLLIEQSEFTNWQRINVQEVNEEIPAGSLPRSVDVIVRDELVERIRPGDKLRFTGHIVVIPDETGLLLPSARMVPLLQGTELNNKKRNIHVKDLNYKLGFSCYGAERIEQKETSEHENRTFNEIQQSSNLYNKLADSLFPSITGHAPIKCAILLMLLGGVKKKTADHLTQRGDINILLVGDPGTAKSQLLLQTAGILENSNYTSGKGTSAAGLTAAVIKDSENHEFCIEPGALMLSNEGICCIDEFDKMNVKDRAAIHEAMEQQTISIAKAGINATLNAQCSVLAAANPVNGMYNPKKTLKQNISLGAALMSRFDLYFVITDMPDNERDVQIADYILRNHQKYQNEERNSATHFNLQEIKLFIKTARKRTPKITENVKEKIVEKYALLRQENLLYPNSYKVTIRHFETLIRLSEALAKLHNTDVLPAYVDEAYRLFKSSIIELKSDDIVLNAVVGEDEQFTVPTKEYVKIVNSIIFIMKNNEKVSKEQLVLLYLEENQKEFENENDLMIWKKKVERVVEYLINYEGVLYESDKIIYIHEEYDI